MQDEHRTLEPVDGNVFNVVDVAPTKRKTPARGSQQAWVRTHLWNKRTRQRGRVLTALLDSGAGGGNYASAKFIHEIEQADYGGRNMISKKGKGRLRAANPENSKEPPMSILGTCLISVVFLPVDKIFAVKVRVVDQLPLSLILGTAFMRRYESSLIFEGPGAG